MEAGIWKVPGIKWRKSPCLCWAEGSGVQGVCEIGLHLWNRDGHLPVPVSVGLGGGGDAERPTRTGVAASSQKFCPGQSCWCFFFF